MRVGIDGVSGLHGHRVPAGPDPARRHPSRRQRLGTVRAVQRAGGHLPHPHHLSHRQHRRRKPHARSRPRPHGITSASRSIPRSFAAACEPRSATGITSAPNRTGRWWTRSSGLWNRRYFDERLAAELASCQRHGRVLSCVMADIDHFKKLNDWCGHPAGDDVIRVVADVLRQGCRGEDSICRYGGEESRSSAPTWPAGRGDPRRALRGAVEAAPLTIPDQHATCSFGVADSTAGAAGLVARADAALVSARTRRPKSRRAPRTRPSGATTSRRPGPELAVKR